MPPSPFGVLRTPDELFENLPDYPFQPHYTGLDGLRIHHVDEGPQGGETVLMLHGEPSWSFLYRKMIPIFVRAGLRAVAPDLVGFGRSDKPADPADYSYQKHVDWVWGWLQANELKDITLVCQNWGALIGLRLVAEHPERFARVVVANGGLPTGALPMPEAFHRWLEFSQKSRYFPIGRIIQNGTQTRLDRPVLAGYEAPFPTEEYKAGARIFPSLVPIQRRDPAAPANRRAWQALKKFDKPFLTAFSDQDPITRSGDALFQKRVPGAQGQPHITVKGAGHFLQEDEGPALARAIVDFVRRR
jgi:haloalkane dehalogenase